MSVYTHVTAEQVNKLLQPLNKGSVRALQGAVDGIENSNYFVTCNTGEQLVLTIFEQVEPNALPFYIAVMELAADSGLPAPKPFRDAHNNAVFWIQDKPAIVVPKLAGGHIQDIAVEHCQQIGRALAIFHNSSSKPQSFDPEHLQVPQRDVYWAQQILPQVESLLSSNELVFLRSELAQWLSLRGNKQIKQGAIHGDLFHDNALFSGNTLTGIIDFYNASFDQLLLDIAIVVNDWCSERDGSLNEEKYHALLASYQALRPFDAMERACWANFLCAAALRFWLSRLWVEAHNRDNPDQPWENKNPNEYKQILLARRAVPAQL